MRGGGAGGWRRVWLARINIGRWRRLESGVDIGGGREGEMCVCVCGRQPAPHPCRSAAPTHPPTHPTHPPTPPTHKHTPLPPPPPAVSPASGISSRRPTPAGRPLPPMANGTGARVWEVRGTALPSSKMGSRVFFLRCVKGV